MKMNNTLCVEIHYSSYEFVFRLWKADGDEAPNGHDDSCNQNGDSFTDGDETTKRHVTQYGSYAAQTRQEAKSR